MFRAPRMFEKVSYQRFRLDTALTQPANGQSQVKTGLKFFVADQDIIYDFYNAYFRVEYQLQKKADGTFVAADVPLAPVSGAFSLIKSLTVSE